MKTETLKTARLADSMANRAPNPVPGDFSAWLDSFMFRVCTEDGHDRKNARKLFKLAWAHYHK